MNTKWILDKESQPMLNSVPEDGVNNLNRISWLARLRQFLVNALMQRNEPKIWQKRDRAGNTWWYVHNPVIGRTVCLASEEEVRIWLEQNYRIG